MISANQDCERACRAFVEHFFARRPDAALQHRVLKASRLFVACDQKLAGRPAGWAAGIVYAAANRDRRACGVPGLLNEELEEFFGVSMATIRRRAAQVTEILAW
jgi:hypothetical protein